MTKMKEIKDLTEEEKKQLEEYNQKVADESLKRQEWIQRHVKSYFRALNGDKLSPEELFMLSMDTIIAGYTMVTRYSDMIEQNVEERINTLASVRAGIDNILQKSLMNKEVVTAQVAQTAIHNAKADKNKLLK